ncbi:MAG: ATP-binding protein [Salinivirgaceae bacterium]
MITRVLLIRTKILLAALLITLNFGARCNDRTITQLEGVLVVHSYHKGFTWTDNVDEGIHEALAKLDGFTNKELFTEFLDAKRNNDSIYFQQLVKLWNVKYNQVKIPVIITSDDIAFQFVMKYRKEIFPESQIVFCGINNLGDYAALIEDPSHSITGVVEGIDLLGTLKLALKLHPDTKHIYIINDQTPTGKANYNAFQLIKNRLPSNVAYTFLSNFKMDAVDSILYKLPPQSLIFLLSYNQDSKGKYFSYEESGKIICNSTSLPVYVVWDFYLGTGAVGGLLVSGKAQGNKAAFLANEILLGTPAVAIPVVTKSPNRFMFDYAALKKFELNKKLIPEDAEIIGKPQRAMEKYKTEIILVLITFTLLIIAVLTLLYYNRKKTLAERSLVKSTNKLLTILETAQEGFFEMDCQHLVTYVNPELCSILGTHKDLLENHTFYDILRANNYSPPESEFKKCFAGEAVSFEYKVASKNGVYKDLVINLSPLFNEGKSKVEGLFGLVSDITYLKTKELEILQAKEQAEKSDKLKSAFLANMSHEIRTPMNAILGFTELLAEKEISEDDRIFYVDIIQKSGQSLLTLINDILDLSKIEAGEIDIIFKPVNVNSLLKNVYHTLMDYGKMIQKNHIHLSYQDLPEDLVIETDDFRLTQILLNLLNNAFKFTEAGFIKFGCKQVAADELEFFVSDTGIGMPKEMQLSIFERFHKIESLKNQVYRGAGLGLAISKNLAELLGGSIFCNSEEGKGTIFYFSIKGKISKTER